MTVREFKGVRWMGIFAILMIAYFSLISLAVSNEIFTGDQVKKLPVVTDFLYLMILPMLGFFYTKKSMKYLREDSYTKDMARMRCMPIPFQVIMISRMMQLVIVMIVNCSIFFGVQYGFSKEIQNSFSLSHFISFALVWTGYGLIVSAVYIYMELSYSGKMYMTLTMIFIFVFLGGLTVLMWMSDFSLLRYSIEITGQWPVALPIAVMLLAMGSLLLSTKLVKRRLMRRDLM